MIRALVVVWLSGVAERETPDIHNARGGVAGLTGSPYKVVHQVFMAFVVEKFEHSSARLRDL